jgi:hypothetical protein
MVGVSSWVALFGYWDYLEGVLGVAPSPPLGAGVPPEVPPPFGPVTPPTAVPPSDGPLWAEDSSTLSPLSAGRMPAGWAPEEGGVLAVEAPPTLAVGFGSQALSSHPAANKTPIHGRR